MSMFVDDLKDYIQFNFSIPKYLFGSNIYQFIEHHHNTVDFEYFRNSDFDYNANKLFERFTDFIDFFINYELMGKYVNKSKLELNRIDLCYNLIFNNSQEASDYFYHLRTLRKKWSRNETPDYGTTLQFRSERYTAQIYRKGHDYRKKGGDKAHHKKINSEFLQKNSKIKVDVDTGEIITVSTNNKKPPFNIDFIEEIAERTIRYELQFHRSYISTIFKNKIFRKNSKYHQNNKEIYNIIRNCKIRTVESWKNAKKHSENLENLKKAYEQQQITYVDYTKLRTNLKSSHELNEQRVISRNAVAHFFDDCEFSRDKLRKIQRYPDKFREFVYDTLPKDIQKFYDDFTKMINKRHLFFLNNDIPKNELLFRTEEKDIEFHLKEITFDKSIMKELIKTFKDFLFEFKLEKFEGVQAISERIDKHNTSIKKIRDIEQNNKYFDSQQKISADKSLRKINSSNLNLVLTLLKTMSLNEIKERNILNIRTFNRIKLKLKEFGYTDNKIEDEHLNYDIHFDFQNYHDIMIHQANKDIQKHEIKYHHLVKQR
jgi:hypothetical protein